VLKVSALVCPAGPVLPAGSDTTTTGAAAAPTTASGAGPIVGAGGTSATPGAGVLLLLLHSTCRQYVHCNKLGGAWVGSSQVASL
jgi:hypothetical protein